MTDYDVKKSISALFPEIIGGDTHVRQQFLNILISYVVTYIKREKLEPNQSSISRFRTRLHETIQAVMRNTHPLPLVDSSREKDIQRLMEYFDKYVITVDASVADEQGLMQVGILRDIEQLENARNICYSASADYSDSLAGKPDGLTNLTIKQAMVIDILIPIIDQYHLVDYGSTGFTSAVSLAANRAESRAKDTEAKRMIQI